VDKISKAKRSAIMSRIRGRGNKRTEISVIQLFRKSGVKGWRRHQTIRFAGSGCVASDGTIFKPQVRPDFIFQKSKIVVFIDGCFWHGCKKCYRPPKSHKKFWSAKILRNLERDRFQSYQLKRIGWRVLRIWEHELLQKNMVRLLCRIQNVLQT
jgi:DNA mismatch endonuclease (patch repair protein)